MAELFLCAAREIFRIGRQNTRAAFEQNDASALGIDGLEFVGQDATRNLGQRSRELYPGRAAADDHEIQRLLEASAVCPAFVQFESQQDTAPDFDGIFDGLQAGSERFPFIMSEIGVAGAGGYDEVVVGNFKIGELHPALLEVEILNLSQQDFDIAMSAHDPADGRGDLGGRKSGGRYLIKQWLESVEVPAVDQRDLDRQAGQMQSSLQAAEAGADDGDSRFGVGCQCMHPVRGSCYSETKE